MFHFMGFVAVTVAIAGMNDESSMTPNPVIHKETLPGAIVEITTNGPEGKTAYPTLTLNENGSVGGSDAVIEPYRNPVILSQGVKCTETKKMEWKASEKSLNITWDIELRSTHYVHALSHSITLSPSPEKANWTGHCNVVVVTNGRLFPAGGETPVSAVVKYRHNPEDLPLPAEAKEEQADKPTSSSSDSSEFHREVATIINQLLSANNGDVKAALKQAEQIRHERGNDPVSVAVEHYLFGLWWHDHSSGILQHTPIPSVAVVAWESITFAWLATIGRPAENPAFTFWGVNWGSGLLNPGDRGDHWLDIIFWDAAGAHGFRPPKPTMAGVPK